MSQSTIIAAYDLPEALLAPQSAPEEAHREWTASTLCSGDGQNPEPGRAVRLTPVEPEAPSAEWIFACSPAGTPPDWGDARMGYWVVASLSLGRVMASFN